MSTAVKTKNPVRSGFCGIKAENWQHGYCRKPGCPCECHQEVAMPTRVPAPPYPPPSGICVVYVRHGEESFEGGWSCLEDAHRFAAWLDEVGAAINVEVIES